MSENQNEITQSNGYAVAGFILSFFVALLGLIFSIMGLKKSKVTNSGRGLSIAGIIISSISMSIVIIAFILIIFAGFMQNMNKNINETISERYCSEAYNCVLNLDGKYNCNYLTDENKIISIVCDNK